MPYLEKWEVQLEDEYGQFHDYSVYAKTRSDAIVKAYDAALAQHHHTANGWNLNWVSREAN